MLTTSSAWDNVFRQNIVPETFVEVELDLSTPYSGSVSFGGSNTASFASGCDIDIVNNVVGVGSKNYALLENNWWILDGSVDVMSENQNYPEYRYVSEQIGNSSIVILGLNFGTKITRTVKGFTICWDDVHGEYPKEFWVRVWDGDALAGEIHETNNTEFCSFVEMEVSGFDFIQVLVNSWSKPNRRTRISGICLGAKLLFTKDDLVSYSCEYNGDPLCSELTSTTVDFSIDNSDGQWDLLNPNGLAKYLAERQDVKVYYGVERQGVVEKILAVTVKLSEWKISSNGLEAKFTARDYLSFSENRYLERTYLNAKTITATNFYENEMLDSPWGGASTAWCSDNTTIKIYERKQFTYYDNNVYVELNSYRTDKGWCLSDNVEITDNNSAQSLFSQAYVGLGVDSGYSQNTVSDELFSNSVMPMPIKIDRTLCSEIMQMILNASGYTFWFAQNGSLKYGKPGNNTGTNNDFFDLDYHYSPPEIELTKPLGSIDIYCVDMYDPGTTHMTGFAYGLGEIVAINNPFILWVPQAIKPNINNICNQYYKFWGERTIISGSFRPNPKFELFDIVPVETKYGQVTVLLTNIKYTYNGAFHGSYVGRKISNAS